MEIVKDKMYGTKRKGRPRKSWIDDVEHDLRTMGVRGWRRVTRETEVHHGL
jgi:hypothetical protein